MPLFQLKQPLLEQNQTENLMLEMGQMHERERRSVLGGRCSEYGMHNCERKRLISDYLGESLQCNRTLTQATS